MTNATNKKKSFFDYFLNFLEKGGNALPHPATLFALFALSVLLLSAVGAWLGWQATHPATGEVITTVNLLSKEGLNQVLNKMVTNFTSFAPLGIVLVAMLGIGIAETSGLIGVFIRMLVLKAPKRILTYWLDAFPYCLDIIRNPLRTGRRHILPTSGIRYNY
ncbi:MAG: hypothetical protein GXY94_08020 [Bacteroidales bacterium]|nr:hypothetical protein [Bacteroidales bacterium]